MNVIGIDIGGTSFKVGLVRSDGEVLDTFTMPVNHQKTNMEMIYDLVYALKSFINDKGPIAGIGIGCPGLIDATKGIVCSSNNLGWKNINLKDIFENELNIPTRITNDANAAALGEVKFGAGKLYKNVVLITLGTGVGSGIVSNGKLYEGNEGKGAEIGHMVIELNGRQCTCGRKGCFEQYASASALISDTKIAMISHPESQMNIVPIDNVDGKVAFAYARQGDKTAMEVVTKYVSFLGEGVLNICNIFRPEAILFSGGIAKEGQFLIDMLKKYCETREYGFPGSPSVELATAQLGYLSGIIGAASLVL